MVQDIEIYLKNFIPVQHLHHQPFDRSSLKPYCFHQILAKETCCYRPYETNLHGRFEEASDHPSFRNSANVSSSVQNCSQRMDALRMDHALSPYLKVRQNKSVMCRPPKQTKHCLGTSNHWLIESEKLNSLKEKDAF